MSIHRMPAHFRGFDPSYNLSCYWGCGNLPYGHKPFTTRGVLPLAFSGLSSTYALGEYGFQYPQLNQQGNTLNANGAATTYLADQNHGSVVACFKALNASSGMPHGQSTIINAQNTSAGTVRFQLAYLFSGQYFFGWFNNAESRAATANANGLWAIGDLVTTGFSYAAGTGGKTTAYSKGIQIAQNTSPALPFDWRGSNLFFDVGNDENGGLGLSNFGQPLYYIIFLDRVLTADEWAYIQDNPFDWFCLKDRADRTFRVFSGIGGAPATGIKQAAVTVIN